MIRAKDICVEKDHLILDSVTLSLEEGSISGIIGKSGAGKSTLLRALSGLEVLKSGVVYYKEERIKGPEIKLIPGYDHIQLVHQGFELDQFHTVSENVKEKILYMHKEERDEEVEKLLELVELTSLRDKQARNISGGEQQRLAIARALATKPEVLLLDEPFVHVDHRLRLKLMNYLLHLNKEEHLTIVLVSHDGEEMMGFVNKIVHLDHGKIHRIEQALTMYHEPKSRSEAELLGLVNEIEYRGRKVLFRPKHYRIGGDIELRFEHCMNTGIECYNYFSTERGEEIVLMSSEPLDHLTSISIERR